MSIFLPRTKRDITLPLLRKKLQEVIICLEKIHDQQNPPSLDLLVQIDTLYAQFVGLVNTPVDTTSTAYDTAVISMRETARLAREAFEDTEDTRKIRKTISRATMAIDHVSELLAGEASV